MSTTEERLKINDLLTWRLLSSYSDEELPMSMALDAAPLLVKNEDVPCVDVAHLAMLNISYIKDRDYEDGKKALIPLHRLNRRICEFSTRYVQLVGAVMLHTDKNIIMLRLKKDNTHVDGYKINTITVPEGHASWDTALFQQDMKCEHFTPRAVISQVMRRCAFREFMEEIGPRIDLDYKSICGRSYEEISSGFRSYMDMVIDTNIDPRNIRTVYVPEAGSSIKHFLVCWDVVVHHGMWAKLIDSHHFLESNEPQKHEVLYVDGASLSSHIGHYDLYVKELLAQAADDWVWKFVYDALPRG